MNLTESESLQERIGKMTNMEFDEWLIEHIKLHATESYNAGYEDADRSSYSYDEGYEEGYEDARAEFYE
jgi:flagellar biosynthesis/type III secretory pathway protein FliH